MEWITILGKAFWCGWGALGFGILFNVPPRTLFAIWIGGAMGGFLKFVLCWKMKGFMTLLLWPIVLNMLRPSTARSGMP